MAFPTLNFIIENCYNGQNLDYCDKITRSDVGYFRHIDQSIDNLSFLGASGVDFGIDYIVGANQIGFGDIGGQFEFELDGSRYITQFNNPRILGFYTSPSGSESENFNCVEYAPNGILDSCSNPISKWKINSRLNYSIGPYEFGARMRLLSNIGRDVSSVFYQGQEVEPLSNNRVHDTFGI